MPTKKTKAEEKGLGANLNAPDSRNITMAVVAAAKGIDVTAHPKKNITDISMLPIEDQEDKGTCVGQAEGKGEEYRDYKETGKVTRVSKKFVYKHCKLKDNFSGEGTFPEIAGGVLNERGAPKEELVPDDNSVPYAEYMKADVESPHILTEASGRRTKGRAYVRTLDELKTAIDTEGVFNASLQVGDWNTLPVKPTKKDGSARGWHRILIKGYEDAKNGKIPDTKIYFRNSWGKNWARGKTSADRKLLKGGDGWFWWSEYVGNYYRDGMVYTDMPNEIIDYAKSQKYIFTRQLDLGMQGTDVMELQKRLRNEVAFDGGPCYGYAVNGVPFYGTVFDPHTQEGVRRYQKTKGIVSTGTPATTGYGRVGPTTMKKLNEDSTPPPVPQKKWVGTPHFNTGRSGFKPEAIVIHVMDGTLTGTDAWFKNPTSRVSAHYGIGKTGEIHQYVKEEDQAWHAGSVVKPKWSLIKKQNPNLYTIGIEHEGTATSAWTEEMKRASANLIREIAERWGIPIDRAHVIGHYEIRSTKPNCPAANKAIIDELIARAKVAGEPEVEEVLPEQEESVIINPMNSIFESPAKIVFIIMAVAVVAALFTGKITGDQFLTLASVAFTFYFVTPNKPTPSDPSGSQK